MTTQERIELAIERGMTYDSETGNIFGPSGKLITSKSKKGYITPAIWFNGKTEHFFGHLFVWYYIHKEIPTLQIDHINGLRDDNRIENLRLVSNQQNSFNRKDTKGYTKRKNGKFRAKINLNGNQISLGEYFTQEEAHDAYLTAKEKYHII